MSSRILALPEGRAALRYSHDGHSLKGEDVVFVVEELQSLCPEPRLMGKWDLFCICDGHGGPEAAEFVKAQLSALVASGLPKGQPPESVTAEGQAWLQAVRSALNAALVQLDLDFRKERILPTVGCTATVALCCGWVLTVANIGDSEAFLDLGSGDPIEVTVSHKIDTNLDEQIRLARCGKEVRPLSEELFRPARPHEEGVGPLRVWPCGLAVSRAIGDYDCGCEVLASPHITQIKVPLAGARLIIASDGLWDHLTAKRVIKRSRKHTINDVPRQLIGKARKSSMLGLCDDTTVLVLDILPTAGTDFKDTSRKLRGPRNVISKWGQRISKKKYNNQPTLILAKEDMAPIEPFPYPPLYSVTSSVSSRGAKSIGVQSHQLRRHRTYTPDATGEITESDSQDEEEGEKSMRTGHSHSGRLMFGQSQHSPAQQLPKFRSSTLEYH